MYFTYGSVSFHVTLFIHLILSFLPSSPLHVHKSVLYCLHFHFKFLWAKLTYFSVVMLLLLLFVSLDSDFHTIIQK